MRLTKWEHACMVLEIANERLVIDPGSLTSPVDGMENVKTVVITHEHADHWTPQQLARIIDTNPDVRILGTEATAAAALHADIATPVEVVHAGDRVVIGPFGLEFVGGEHAIIHSSIPRIHNVGVLVNEQFYYPGDSFALPGKQIDVLAAPASAPWMKMSETMDFILEVKPRLVVQAHEMVNSQYGNDLMTARMQWSAEQVGGEHRWLQPGDSIDIA
ncbi:MAG TPA: MBL fold metallo-hydrolase [Microbacteriaceae bacterium]|nr:MBL fold metallo-hydrolase [Microbacteriaceae bacterium]